MDDPKIFVVARAVQTLQDISQSNPGGISSHLLGNSTQKNPKFSNISMDFELTIV